MFINIFDEAPELNFGIFSSSTLVRSPAVNKMLHASGAPLSGNTNTYSWRVAKIQRLRREDPRRPGAGAGAGAGGGRRGRSDAASPPARVAWGVGWGRGEWGVGRGVWGVGCYDPGFGEWNLAPGVAE